MPLTITLEHNGVSRSHTFKMTDERAAAFLESLHPEAATHAAPEEMTPKEKKAWVLDRAIEAIRDMSVGYVAQKEGDRLIRQQQASVMQSIRESLE